MKKAHSVSRCLKAGTVWINTYGLMDASLPFGGYKSSGFGRELGAHAVEHYTELKTVWLNMGCLGERTGQARTVPAGEPNNPED